MRDQPEESSELLTKRVIIPMSEEMASAIQEYRFTNRLESRAAAVRKLITLGLEADKSQKQKK